MKNSKQGSTKNRGSSNAQPSKKDKLRLNKQNIKHQKGKHNSQRRPESSDAPGQGRHPSAINTKNRGGQASTSGRHQQQGRPSEGGFSLKSLQGSGNKKGGSGLLDKMRQQLQGGRFRWLNEQLYTTAGEEALELMEKDPALYDQYHQGFREQTKGWPQQPVELAIRWLSKKPSNWVVADLGCGDAQLASSVDQKVKSFDLVAGVPGVVACNMAELPLSDNTVDVAVFSLSLMGTDYGLFLEEAARVLKKTGWIWIAEVQSRFIDSAGNNMLDDFISAVASLGFKLKHKDLRNSYFLLLEFQGEAERKSGGKKVGNILDWPELRPCQYKKR